MTVTKSYLNGLGYTTVAIHEFCELLEALEVEVDGRKE